MYDEQIASEVVVTYGGSVNEVNCKEISKLEGVDGALVGGASLKIDSFHAMVFSLVFHKQFTFLQRAGCGINMNSRIQTLINKFQIPINELSNITEINEVATK